MIVHDLHLVGFAAVPNEADAPLVVDANAVLSFTVARKGLKPVPRRNSQVVQVRGVIQHHQLDLRPTLDVFREPADALAFGYCPGIPVAVALDHSLIIVSRTISVKHY